MRSFVAVALLLISACSEDNDDGLAPDTAVGDVPALSNAPRVSITFTALGNANGFLCQFDGSAQFECISPFEADVTDGPHTFAVAAKLNAAVDETPATAAFTTDITPPDTNLISGPAVIDNSLTAEFTFEGSDSAPGAVTFECSLDGAAFTACSSPHQQAVTEGSRNFSVRAKDLAGNVDASPAMLAWTVDTTAPDTTITSGPANGSSTGATVSFEFTSPEVGATFECSKEGGAFTTCVSGASFTYTNGPATFAVRAKDSTGTVDPTPATRAWTVDLTAPDVTITSTPTNPSNDPTPTFGFTSTDPSATFECQVDGLVTFTACTSPWTSPTLTAGSRTFRVRATDPTGNNATDTHTWVIDLSPPTVTITGGPSGATPDPTPTFTFTTGGTPATTQCHIDSGALVSCTAGTFTAPAQGDGPHTFEVIVTDAAGNSANATRSFTVDTTPPTVAITSGPTGLTSDRTPTFTFTTGGSPATTMCHIDSGALVSCTAGTFTAATLADGAHTFEVIVTDAVGNDSNATRSFTVDGTPPTVTITGGPSGTTADPTPTFTFTTGGSPATTQCHIDTGALVSCTAGTFTAATLADGAHTFEVIVADAVGNATNATRSFTVDGTPPTVTITGGPSGVTADPTPTFTFTTGGSPVSTECHIDTGALVSCTSGTFTAAAQGDGPHTFEVIVTDAAGNSDNATRSFTVDTTPPTVTITGGPTGTTGDRTPTFTFTTTGSPATTQCHIDSLALVSCTAGTFTAATLADGPHTFEVIVTDAVGNDSNATRSFTVDGTPPTVTITGGPTGTTTDPTPTFTFTTGGSPTSTQCHIDSQPLVDCTGGSFTSGTLGDGAHTFQVVVTDAASNSANATRSFTVDASPPTVVFDDVPPANWPVDYYTVVYHATEAGSTFECSISGAAFATCGSSLAVTNTPYNVGANVRVRATDGAGNTGPIATTSWTPRDGLVLHYPWEQGRTHNSSLLAQRPAYSPDGPAAAQPFLGGWAGAALGPAISAHTYAGTAPALSSSANGNYTASFWIRTNNDVGNGTLFSTLGATGGLRVRISGNQLSVDVREGAQIFTGSVGVPMDRWASIALIATGPGKGLLIAVDGQVSGQVSVPTATGFDAGQGNLVVGTFSNVDVDDLRFYNREMTNGLCTVIARGFIGAAGACVPGSPGLEMDFERGLAETGLWGLDSTTPRSQGFYTSTLGQGFQPPGAVPPWGVVGWRAPAQSSPAHSISLWFHENGAFGPLINFLGSCVVGGPAVCGIRVDYSDDGIITIFAGTDAGVQHNKSYAVARGKPNSVVITEQKTDPKFTNSLTIYINGIKVDTLTIGAGDVYQDVSDGFALVQAGGGTIDEVEVWQTDLSKNDEWLCENGHDGEFDAVSGACLLTAN